MNQFGPALQQEAPSSKATWTECACGANPKGNAMPETVEVSLSLLQRAVAALEAAGKVLPRAPEDVRPIVEAQAVGIWLQAYVQNAINETT